MGATHVVTSSPLGELTLVAEQGRLTGLYFPHHWYAPHPASFGPRADGGFDDAKAQLAEYFAGQRERFDLPYAARGDAFHHRVWELIGSIPYGQTVSYGDLARRLGGQVTAKEAGAAVARNPLCVIVPCHRVVGSDGRLTGYAGGLARKLFLLRLERSRLEHSRREDHDLTFSPAGAFTTHDG